jgi:hypothetical protein
MGKRPGIMAQLESETNAKWYSVTTNYGPCIANVNWCSVMVGLGQASHADVILQSLIRCRCVPSTNNWKRALQQMSL